MIPSNCSLEDLDGIVYFYISNVLAQLAQLAQLGLYSVFQYDDVACIRHHAKLEGKQNVRILSREYTTGEVYLFWMVFRNVEVLSGNLFGS